LYVKHDEDYGICVGYRGRFRGQYMYRLTYGPEGFSEGGLSIRQDFLRHISAIVAEIEAGVGDVAADVPAGITGRPVGRGELEGLVISVPLSESGPLGAVLRRVVTTLATAQETGWSDLETLFPALERNQESIEVALREAVIPEDSLLFKKVALASRRCYVAGLHFQGGADTTTTQPYLEAGLKRYRQALEMTR
jgi:hypothetical protein